MQKQMKGRALLLAGVSAVVLGGALPSSANPLKEAADKAPDIIVPEPDTRKQTAEKFVPKVTRTTVTRTLTTSSGTTTQILETPSEYGLPAVATPPVPAPLAPKKPRGETVGLLSKPVDETLTAKAPKSAKQSKSKTAEKADKIPSAVPAGQLHIIVSVDQQRASLYANGQLVASTKVSTGTKSHPTPMGVFSVIQKNRHHVSNLYSARCRTCSG